MKLPAFEGPLDLLLHLCRANEVDITNIPIALISEQYLQYLELMKLLDIDVAAEYLLMAATLAQIKSRMLLPVDPDAPDDEGVDPRAELARRLAEYAIYQDAARDLADRPRLGRDVFEGHADRSQIRSVEATLSVSLFSLVDAMQRVLSRIPEVERHHEVHLEHLTLAERMLTVMERLRALADEAIPFEELLSDGILTRHRVVVTFLALLELTRLRALTLFQNMSDGGVPHGPIWARLSQEGRPNDAFLRRAALRAEEELERRVSLDDSPPPEDPESGEEP